MINKNPTKPGTYLYKMPHWDAPTKVKVVMGISRDGRGEELHVIFTPGTYPDRMNNIPAAACWEKYEENQ